MGVIECSYRYCCSFGLAWCKVGKGEGYRGETEASGGKSREEGGELEEKAALSSSCYVSGRLILDDNLNVKYSPSISPGKKPISSNPCWQSRSRKHLGPQWAALEERAELPKNHKTASKSRNISWGKWPHTQGSCWSHPRAAVNNHKQKHGMTENINVRVNVFKGKSSQRSEKTPNGSGQSQLLPFLGCPSHLMQDSSLCLLGRGFESYMSSSFPVALDGALGGCAGWEDVFPKQPASGAACGSQRSSTEPLHVCCVPKHPHYKYSCSSPLESQDSLFPPPPPPSFCWHRRGLTLLPWLCGWSSGMDPEETAQVSSPTLAVLKHIFPKTFSCKTANARSLG